MRPKASTTQPKRHRPTWRLSAWRPSTRQLPTRKLSTRLPVVALAIAGLLVTSAPAHAYQVPNTPAQPASGGMALTMPGSGLKATFTGSGRTSIVTEPSTIGSRGYVASDFAQGLAQGTPAVQVRTLLTNNCPAEGTCDGLGELKITFNAPVTDPVLSIAALGGHVGHVDDRTAKQSNLHSELTLTTPGVTLSKLSGANLSVQSNTIAPTNPNVSMFCNTTQNVDETGNLPSVLPGAATAGCGSVQVTGTVTSLTFEVSGGLVKAPGATAPLTCSAPNNDCVAANGDVYQVTVTAGEDFGDAPASYDQGNAARAVLSDVTLGATVTEDNKTTANATSSPYANNEDGGDDGVVLAPLNVGDTSYTVPVTIAGARSAGTVCGWVDFNHNGVFDAGERVCAPVAAGATSATLTWANVPALTAGATWARFRVGYDATQTGSPTGASNAGEVEDYPLTIGGAADLTPHLTVNKTADVFRVTVVGQKVKYTFHVTNDGKSPLTGVRVKEQNFTGHGPAPVVTCPKTALAVGEEMNCTAEYTVTAEDIAAGGLTNTAVATGTPPGSGDPIDSDPDSVLTPSEVNPKLTLLKSADPASVMAAGDAVTYTFRVKNAGDVQLDGVTVRETTFTGAGATPAITCPKTTLAAGEHMDCHATYRVTQADIAKGVIDNTAVAEGMVPRQGSDAPSLVMSDPSDAQVTAATAPGLSLVKTADKTTITMVGEVVKYSFAVKNTGNTELTKVNVTEKTFTGTGKMSAVTCPDTALAPGAATTCTATYVVTAADLVAGKLDNTAIAHGTPPGDGATPIDSPPGTNQVIAKPPVPAVTMTKIAEPTTVTSAGQSVKYTFRVNNTGDVALDAVRIDETAFTGTGKLSTITCPKTALGVGETTDCTATYVVTAADLAAGKVDNTAVAVATPVSGGPDGPGGEPGGDPSGDPGDGDPSGNPGGDPGDGTPNGPSGPGDPITSPPSSTQVLAPGKPGIAVVKTADKTTVTQVGEVITYSFAVKNTGSAALTKVNVEEKTFTGTGKMSAVTCPKTALAVGETTTCTATYTTTAADLAAGKLDNTAIAHGTPPGDGATPIDSPPGTNQVIAKPQVPAISLVKTADPTTVTQPGQTVKYTFTVTNTGDAALEKLRIDETAFTGTGKMSAVTCPKTALAVGAATSCTATYAVTAADFDAGRIDNTAVAVATPVGATGSGGGTVSGTSGSTVAIKSLPSSAQVLAPGRPAIEIVKTVNTQIAHPGDVLTYTFTVKNPGNVTLHDVTIGEQDFSGSGTLSAVTCPTTTVNAGASIACTATYTVTDADLVRGRIDNTATASGSSPDGHGGVLITSKPGTVSVTVTSGQMVLSATGPLAMTGSAVGPLLGVAAGLLAIGIGVLVARRRSSARAHRAQSAQLALAQAEVARPEVVRPEVARPAPNGAAPTRPAVAGPDDAAQPDAAHQPE